MDKFVKAKTLAEALGITERRVNQLTTDDGLFKRDLNGKYDLVQCVHDYYKEKFTSDDKLNFDTEKALHEKAKREKAEIHLAQLKNELHSASDVELVMTNMLTTFKNKILAIPSKVAPKLIGQKNISSISSILDRELHEALVELSEYDPSLFNMVGEDIGEENPGTV